ncbi:HDOD domain-containing protein [Oceanicoccus sp. KOV_DT_Chl]|uniref:HDOD domain-containing protein n=1 Tax=Oceanicoccus sp. KOV_DT_Chl TaxID=1904639 RepID=UPI000C7AC55C|nr:HDOD domain-containing protein [Oceanicoccus sp. KOV_DT_Chl]
MPAPQTTKQSEQHQHWLTMLATFELPVNPEVKQAALQKLHSPTANANNIANILQADPALCLLVMCSANSSLAAAGNETQSLTHAISLLGFPRAEQLIQQSQEYPADFAYLPEYQQQLNLSLHAAYQASCWAKLNPYWSTVDCYWSALFQRAPLWALWFHGGAQMRQLQQLYAADPANSRQQQLQILGTDINSLAAELSQHWHLPTGSQHSWQTDVSGDEEIWQQLSELEANTAQPALEAYPDWQQLCASSGFLIALANRFADHADWDWYSDATLQDQQVLATALNRSGDDMIACTHQQAAEFSRQSLLNNPLTPALRLISGYQHAEHLHEVDQQNTEQTVADTVSLTNTKPSTNTTTQPTAANTTSAPHNTINQALLANAPTGFIESIERLQQQANSFSGLHDVMNFAVNSLCEHAGFERASAGLLNIASKELRTYYSCGATDSPALKNFRHTLRKGDLFNKLFQQPVSVRLQASSHAKIWPLLPGNFKQACAADEFMMMSIFSHKKPVALIYADRGLSNRPLSDRQYSLFKQCCSAISHCLQASNLP